MGRAEEPGFLGSRLPCFSPAAPLCRAPSSTTQRGHNPCRVSSNILSLQSGLLPCQELTSPTASFTFLPTYFYSQTVLSKASFFIS